MAINPETQYAGKIAPATAAYPYGQARNITLPGDGTGTPWEAALVNDIFGFQQSLLSESQIVPSGNPEEVGASQYLQALKFLFGSTLAAVSESFAGKTAVDGQAFQVVGWREGGSALAGYSGGGVFVGDTGTAKTEHNGITIISPTVPAASAQTGGSPEEREANFRAGVGETDPTGSGVFVRAAVDPGNIRAEWAGVKADNSGNDDYQAWVDILAYAAAAFDGAQGAQVNCKYGVTHISDTIVLPNRVAVSGPNGRGLVWKPHSSFVANYMFDAVNGTSSMFGSRLEECYIDARGFNMLAPIRSQAWQETCGLRNVVIQYDGTTPYGLFITQGYGGAAYLPLKDIEIFADSTDPTPTPIFVDTISTVGGFVLSIDGATIAGTATNPVGRGVYMENDSLIAKGCHVEYCENAIVANGVGGVSVDTLTGSANAVTDLLALISTFTGKVSARNLIPNGATGNSVKNNITGANLPASLGIIPDYAYPSVRSENTALAWVVFDGANGTILESFNVASVTRSAVGQYTLNFDDALPAGERSVAATTNVDSVDAVVVTATGGTATSEAIRVRRLGSFAGAYYDAQRVRVAIFGNSVV